MAVTSRFLKKPSEIAPRFQSQRYLKFLDSASDPRTKQGGFILKCEFEIDIEWTASYWSAVKNYRYFPRFNFPWQQESWRKNKHHVTAHGSLKRWKFRILCSWFSKMRAQKYDVRKVCFGLGNNRWLLEDCTPAFLIPSPNDFLKPLRLFLWP